MITEVTFLESKEEDFSEEIEIIVIMLTLTITEVEAEVVTEIEIIKIETKITKITEIEDKIIIHKIVK
jgi:hypothetical protein